MMKLELNDYQAANLRWLLCNANDGKLPDANTGDWCGELRWALEQQMIESDCQHHPNRSEYYPPLQGIFNGMKEREYKERTVARSFSLIRLVLALKNPTDQEKLRWISEIAPAGCVGLDLARALKAEGYAVPK